jgi:hypothetical protein
MKIFGLVVLGALVLAVLTGACQGGHFFTYTGDPFASGESGSASTSALTSNQLPPPKPPSAAIHRAARPAAWAADVCGAVKGWDADWKTRVRALDQSLASANDLGETRSLYVAFWNDTASKTELLLRQFDAAGHPAVRGGEGVARAYRLVFAKTLPPMQMARAVAVALPDDPERLSAGLAEIRSNMARAFDVRDQDLFTLHAKLDKTLPDELRAAIDHDPVCRAL